MEEVGSTNNVNILALVDRSPLYDTTNGDWSDTRLYRITLDANTSVINSQLLIRYVELDMSDPQTLRNFIVYCRQPYPALHTALVLHYYPFKGRVLFHTRYSEYFKENLHMLDAPGFLAELTRRIPPMRLQLIRRYGLYASRTDRAVGTDAVACGAFA